MRKQRVDASPLMHSSYDDPPMEPPPPKSPSASPATEAAAAPAGVWGLRLRRALIVCAIVFGVEFAGLVVVATLRIPPGDTYGYVMLGTLGLTALIGLARFIYVLAAVLQSRLSEWLLTLIAAGALVPLESALLKWQHDLYVHMDHDYRQIWLMAVAAAAAILGSAWGWSLCHRARIEKAADRALLLAAGWFFVYGLAFLSLLGIFLIIGLVQKLARGGSSLGSDYWSVISTLMLLSLLAVPGFVLELTFRSKARRR
jgi:hypothetical protein